MHLRGEPNRPPSLRQNDKTAKQSARIGPGQLAEGPLGGIILVNSGSEAILPHPPVGSQGQRDTLPRFFLSDQGVKVNGCKY